MSATDETDEELYEQAIAEGGEVTLYSISSRCTAVADAFMAKYPEITWHRVRHLHQRAAGQGHP